MEKQERKIVKANKINYKELLERQKLKVNLTFNVIKTIKDDLMQEKLMIAEEVLLYEALRIANKKLTRLLLHYNEIRTKKEINEQYSNELQK